HPPSLFHKPIPLPPQQQIQTLGYPIQSPITTQHPTNHFIPHSPTIIPYPSTPPFALPLHPPHPFQPPQISPYYHSLLLKLSTHPITFKQPQQKIQP
ncbi:hypothetical protein, partial [Staphylococcus hominis]|uniref:hypothetical protein n=1 Tax=Staphylococcus hominis TaxID=1290 RepID=UPI001C92DB8D